MINKIKSAEEFFLKKYLVILSFHYKLLTPASFGHLAGVDVDSVPEAMWTPCRRT
jgi:hypothetical protein